MSGLQKNYRRKKQVSLKNFPYQKISNPNLPTKTKVFLIGWGSIFLKLWVKLWVSKPLRGFETHRTGFKSLQGLKNLTLTASDCCNLSIFRIKHSTLNTQYSTAKWSPYGFLFSVSLLFYWLLHVAYWVFFFCLISEDMMFLNGLIQKMSLSTFIIIFMMKQK